LRLPRCKGRIFGSPHNSPQVDFDLDQTRRCRLAAPIPYEGEKRVSDFCYSRPMLEWVFRQVALMDRMMDHLGVDVVMAARCDRGMA
jgi:hypothetical protein